MEYSYGIFQILTDSNKRVADLVNWRMFWVTLNRLAFSKRLIKQKPCFDWLISKNPF